LPGEGTLSGSAAKGVGSIVVLGSTALTDRPPFTAWARGDVKQLARFPHQDTMPHSSRYYERLSGSYLNGVLDTIFFEDDTHTP
jgi:hypothetical protein